MGKIFDGTPYGDTSYDAATRNAFVVGLQFKLDSAAFGGLTEGQ